jgi:N-acyl-L-homoserine lactone synthetase
VRDGIHGDGIPNVRCRTMKSYLSVRETPVADTLLAGIDAKAARNVAWAAPIRFAVARTTSELEAVYRLRYLVVVERGWATPMDYPDGLERDPYDDRSVQIAAWDGEALAATCRLALPMPGELLPTEAAFGQKIRPRGRVLDVGRVCVASGYRSSQHQVFWGLLGQIWLEMRARGFTLACSTLSRPVARMYRNWYRTWGLELVSLGPPRAYLGELRFPALIQPATPVSGDGAAHLDSPSAVPQGA